jgi:hypothetical protein
MQSNRTSSDVWTAQKGSTEVLEFSKKFLMAYSLLPIITSKSYMTLVEKAFSPRIL